MGRYSIRVPITRHDVDGRVIDGTALWDAHDGDEFGGFSVSDFRDLDGVELNLPPGSSFAFALLGDSEDVES